MTKSFRLLKNRLLVFMVKVSLPFVLKLEGFVLEGERYDLKKRNV